MAADIIDFATRQRRANTPCRHRDIVLLGGEIRCAHCGSELEGTYAVLILNVRLATALRQARAALAPRQSDLVRSETGRAAIAAAREILGERE